MESAWRQNTGSLTIEGWLLMNSVTDSCFEIIVCHYRCELRSNTQILMQLFLIKLKSMESQQDDSPDEYWGIWRLIESLKKIYLYSICFWFNI